LNDSVGEKKKKLEEWELPSMHNNFIKVKMDMPRLGNYVADEMEAFCFDVTADSEREHHEKYKLSDAKPKSRAGDQQPIANNSITLSTNLTPTAAELKGKTIHLAGTNSNLNVSPANLDRVSSKVITTSIDSLKRQRKMAKVKPTDDPQVKSLGVIDNREVKKVKELRISYERDSVSNNNELSDSPERKVMKTPLKTSFWFFTPEFENILKTKNHGKSYRQFQDAIDQDNEKINNLLKELIYEDKPIDKQFDVRSFQDRSMLFVMSCFKYKQSFWKNLSR